MHVLPQTGFVRLTQIIGDKRQDPPIPGIIPVCASTWWKGVKAGSFPAPIKLSSNCTAWRVEDIRELIESFRQEGSA